MPLKNMAQSKTLKIGLVLDTSLDPPDGVQQYVISVGEWLRSRGHNVHYLVGESKRADIQNIHSLARNISVRFNGNRTTIPLPASRKRLKEFLIQEQFDVLHVQMPHSPFMSQRLILAAPDKTAIVGTFHIAPYNRMVSFGTRALGIWLKPSLKRLDKIMSVSSAASQFAKSSFGVDSDILPNVIDYDAFHDAQPLPEYSNNTITILFLGRLVPRKGSEVLVEAVRILSQRSNGPDFKVLICGKGPLGPKLKKRITSYGLDNIVTLTGFVSEDDKPRYYATADISVFPSQGGESFGIVLLEAMASGKSAVLAGDNPGYRSVMSPQPKQLFDPYNASSLADLLSQYIRHKNVRQRAQSWGEAYSAGFDIAIVGKRLEDIYRQALRNHSQQ